MSLIIKLHYLVLNPPEIQTRHKIVESKRTFKDLAGRRILGKALDFATHTGFNSWTCTVTALQSWVRRRTSLSLHLTNDVK